MPKLNLPGLNRKKGSPEDLNFQCMDDGSVISGCEETPNNIPGLGGMLEAQRPKEKKSTAAASTVSVFQRLKTLGTRNKKNKSDDTVITSFGENDKVNEEEEEDEDSSSSSSYDEVFQYGKTQLPSTLMDLGDESSTADEGDDPLQYMPSTASMKKSGAASVMPGGSRRPAQTQNDAFQFMDAAPKKKMSSSASVMPSSNGAKVSRPSLLAAPSGRGDFAAHLSPGKNDRTKPSRPSLLAAPSGRGDFAQHTSPRKEKMNGASSVVPPSLSSNDEDAAVPLPRPKLLPAPSNRGDMMDYVTPVRSPKPKLSTLPALPTQEEGDEDGEEENENEQQGQEKEKEQQLQQQQRRRPRRRADGSLRSSGGSVALAATAERQPRRRVASRSGNTNETTTTANKGVEQQADRPSRRRNAPRASEEQTRQHNNSNNHNNLGNIQEDGEESEPENESPPMTAPLTPGGTKQKVRRKLSDPNENVPSTPRSTKGSPLPLPAPTREEIRRRIKSLSSGDTVETGPVEPPIPASPRRRVPSKGTHDDSHAPGTPSHRSPSKGRRPIQKTHADGTAKDLPKVPASPQPRKPDGSDSAKNIPKVPASPKPRKHDGNDSAKDLPKAPASPKPRKHGSSPRKGAKSKLSKDSSLMAIFEMGAQEAANQPKKPKESESTGGFLMAPPKKTKTQNLRAQMLRAPSCSNFQMDAAVGKGGRSGKASRNLLGNHFDSGDGPKSQKRSSATVTGHDITDQIRRIDRRPKPKEKKTNGSASVVPMPTTLQSLREENDADDKDEEKGVRNDTAKMIDICDDSIQEDEDEARKEMEKELLGFLSSQSQHGKRRASMSDVPSVVDENEQNKGKDPSEQLKDGISCRAPGGSRRHSLSSVHKEEKSTQLDANTLREVQKEGGMDNFFESKRISGGPKKRDAQSVIVGKSSNFYPKGPRSKSKTSDDLDLRGSKANSHSQPIAKSPPHEGLTKQDLIAAEANPYGKKSLFESAQNTIKEEEGEEHDIAAKKSQAEIPRKKPTEGRAGRPEGARPRRMKRATEADHPREGEGGEGDEGRGTHANKKPLPSKSPRVRAGNPRRPNERRPHRGSPTSVINGATPTSASAAGPRRNSLGNKIRTDNDRAPPPARSKSDDLVSLSSHYDDHAGGEAGVAAQLNFLPNDGDIGVKYNDVVSVLGESWRRM
mmetsp:Transcript_2724/g.5684  ORF Transcript_2724/g.5684 Transcript_2724/m.5684 type:complete len:1178 (-) Transcript_2724:49-3582(-)